MKIRYCVLAGIGLGLFIDSMLNLFDAFSLKYLIIMFIGVIIWIIARFLMKKH